MTPSNFPPDIFSAEVFFLGPCHSIECWETWKRNSTQKGCSTNNKNGNPCFTGFGMNEGPCFFGAENYDVRASSRHKSDLLIFFGSGWESSDTGHGVGVGVLPVLPYIHFWFSERDFAGRSCSFSSTSSFRCILWLLELHISRVQWVVLVTVGRATFFQAFLVSCHSCVFCRV